MKKKSYMNIKNIISEGFLDKITKFLAPRALKKNPKLKKGMDQINNDMKEFEDNYNAWRKSVGKKPVKFKKVTVKDLF